MHILMDKLYQALKESSEILIYGTGLYSKMVYPLLKKAGLKQKISYFVITERSDVVSSIDGIRVISKGELDNLNLTDAIILIAVSEKYGQEILNGLEHIIFHQILSLTDFIISDSELQKMSDECLLEHIGEYYRWNKGELIQKSGKEDGEFIGGGTINADKKMILHITGLIEPRTVKIAGALLRKGYQIVVLDYSDPAMDNNVIKSELQKLNIIFYRCPDIMELLYLALQYNPLVYWFEPRWGEHSAAGIMIKHRELFGKIVISLYDVFNDSYVKISNFQKKIERYCLENADGIMWRYFSKEYLEEKDGFVYRGKSIQFLDYCAGYHIVEKDSSTKNLKLCFVCGALDLVLDENTRNNGEYVEEAKLENILKMIGSREDCLFHVFAGRGNDKDIETCKLFEQKYPNFKVFYGTQHDELIQKISEYDYGCFLYTGGKAIPDRITINGKYYGSAYVNSTSNRFFDYIDAGIPIIATRPIKLCDYFNELGIIVKMDISNIDIDYLKKEKKAYRKNVKKAQKELWIDNQISRLVDFFEEL